MLTRLYTSSHGVQRHGLPEEFRRRFSDHPARFGRFEVKATPGQCMSNSIQEKIIKDMKEHAPEPQIIIVSLGDNNLRPRGLSRGHSLTEVTSCHEAIMREASNLQNVQLVIVGLLPCPKYETVTKMPFKSASQELKRMCREHRGCHFIDIAKKFVCNKVVNPNLFSDGIHMNQQGREKYSEHVFRFILALPNVNV